MRSRLSFPIAKILLIFILLLNISYAKNNEDGSDVVILNDSLPKAVALKIDISPIIDGEVLSDPIWQGAPPISNFWQTAPYEGQPSSEKTEVYVAYTSSILYFGVVCYDRDPNGIIVSSSRRDASLQETDSFQILLDTYLDKQNGFLFGTNPIGIEYDAQITNEGMGRFGSGGGGFNLNWDGSWEVKTKVSDVGWSAEFAIPFKTLRYSDAKSQIWGLNFQRNIRRKNENAFWVKLPRQFNIQKISLAGSLEGLINLSQRNLKIIPYALGKMNRDFETQFEFDRESNFGLDIKYGLTPALTLDATYNTDFAQVEADQFQINLDRFNLRFPEKRGFFLENAGYFGLGDPGEVELFFSRRIGISDDREVPILAGARVSGKAAGLNIGFLNMQTETVSADTIPGNNFTVARISKQLPNRSSIGGIIVNRSGTGDLSLKKDYNRTFGIDGRLGIGKYWNLSGFAAGTNTPDVEGKEYAYKFAADYDSPFWLYSVSYTEVSEDFNPEVGFLRRSGYRKPTAMILYRWRPADFFGFLELRPHASYRGYWNFDSFQESGHLHIDNHWEWKNGYEFHSGINFTQEGVREAFEIYPGVFVPAGNYQHKEAQLVFNTNMGEWWSFQIRSFIGGFFGGERVNITPSFSFRLGETFNTSFSLSRNDIDLPNGDFITNLFSTQLSYSFTPKMYIQALFQVNDRDDIAGLNIRFGWLQTANSGLFLVYNDSRISEDRIFQISRYRTFVVKYSYMFDLL